MIQRRQTLYLLTIVILGVILCFVSVLQFTTAEEDAVKRMFFLSAFGLEEVTDMTSQGLESVAFQGIWGLLLTSALIPLLALVDIFLFKNRVLQARLNIFLAVLCIGYYGILLMYVWFIRRAVDVADWNVCFGACIPLVCFILTLGATRLILKDEALVRAADRLR